MPSPSCKGLPSDGSHQRQAGKRRLVQEKEASHVAPRKQLKKAHVLVASKFFGGSTSRFFDAHAPTKGSFEPLIAGEPHTLILGTQASDNALDRGCAFATNENVFWHIVGDALGFRRGFHIRRSEAVASIGRHLLHPPETACSYDEAVSRLLDSGFALWDIVAESERGGSLDQDIRNPKFHDVRSLVEAHPSIRRICFATGAGSAKIFRGAWRQWLATPGTFRPAPNRASRDVFARYVWEPRLGDTPGEGRGSMRRPACERDGTLADTSSACASSSTSMDGCEEPGHKLVSGAGGHGRLACQPIELAVMESVSPAAVPLVAAKDRRKRAAAYGAAGLADLAEVAPRAAAYAWKRARWFEVCFADSGQLRPEARAVLPFGSRATDFEPDDADQRITL